MSRASAGAGKQLEKGLNRTSVGRSKKLEKELGRTSAGAGKQLEKGLSRTSVGRGKQFVSSGPEIFGSIFHLTVVSVVNRNLSSHTKHINLNAVGDGSYPNYLKLQTPFHEGLNSETYP